MFKKPVFWVIFVLVFIICSIFTVRYFPHAFPVVTLDLKMDRQAALQAAEEQTQLHRWGPEDYRQAATFRLDGRVRNFVELEAGGNEAYRKMLKGDLYSPYTWQVRHFKEGETNEVRMNFTPEGDPYGFREKLPEDEPGASLTPDSALVIGETTAEETWHIDLSAYEMVEQSQEVRPGGRTDHTIVYERPDVVIGEGRYRLRLVVGGDRLTELTHFVKVPEAFSRRYREMRSANRTLNNTATIATAVLYVLGGVIIGLFFLLRQRWVIWRKPLYWGAFVAFMQVLTMINFWPLEWMYYDTALSAHGFLLQQIFQLFAVFVSLTVLLAVVFMAAESLTRKAFPNHIQFWRLWSPDVAGSSAVLGRTAGGFLLMGIDFAFLIGFYMFTSKVLGWWNPSSTLYEPDLMAAYFPWLTSISISLRAGFMEECLFRAIPIAGAVLLSQRFGNRKAWIIGAFIIQALIFGGAHADYAQQPFYARMVELFIPSLIFGAVYFYFGLLPAIILHFGIDVVAISLPIMVSTSSGAWVDKVLVVILLLVPLWVVLRARLRRKRWTPIEDKHYNQSWQPVAVVEGEAAVERIEEGYETRMKRSRWLLMGGGIVGLIIWFLVANFQNFAPSLTMSRDDAVNLARKELAKRNIDLPDNWKVLKKVTSPKGQDDRFIWQTGGKENYKSLMGKYIPPPRWKIRFAQFEGDVAERAEEYRVYTSRVGEVARFIHLLPEARPGATISEEEAREMAYSVITDKYGLDPALLKEISAEPSKLPERRDWKLTFADTINYPLDEGEARIEVKIGGDEVLYSNRYIHVPEEWQRSERDTRNLNQIFQGLCGLIMFLIIIAGVAGAIVRWSRKKFSVSVFLTFLVLLFGIKIIDILNGWQSEIAGFSTSEPFSNQVFMSLALPILGAIFLAAGLALVNGMVQEWRREQSWMRSPVSVRSGFSLGVLIAGLFALVALIKPSLEPLWAKYEVLGSYVPFLGITIDHVEKFILATTLFLLIITAVDRFTDGWTRKKLLFGILLVLFGLFQTGAGSVDSLSSWLLTGLLTGIIILLTYVFIVRFQLSVIPLITGAVIIMTALKGGIVGGHPAAIPGAVVAIILTVLLSVLWHNSCSEPGSSGEI